MEIKIGDLVLKGLPPGWRLYRKPCPPFPNLYGAIMPVFTDDEALGFALSLAVVGQRIHTQCVEKGFWPEDKAQRNLGEALFLVTTEMAEWLEWVRKGEGTAQSTNLWKVETLGSASFTNEEEEAADTLIRLLDLCGGRGLRLGEAVIAKMEYNASRPYKHGKEF